jgi:hypothetical protein
MSSRPKLFYLFEEVADIEIRSMTDVQKQICGIGDIAGLILRGLWRQRKSLGVIC